MPPFINYSAVSLAYTAAVTAAIQAAVPGAEPLHGDQGNEMFVSNVPKDAAIARLLPLVRENPLFLDGDGAPATCSGLAREYGGADGQTPAPVPVDLSQYVLRSDFDALKRYSDGQAIQIAKLKAQLATKSTATDGAGSTGGGPGTQAGTAS